MARQHHYLELKARYHMNQKAAEAEVLRVLRLVKPGRKSKDLKRLDWTFNKGERGEFTTNFRELVSTTRRTGYAGPVQDLIDRRDRWFGGRLNMSVNGEAMSIGHTFGPHQMKLQGPAFIHLVEDELAADIEAFRSRACECSERSSLNFSELGRNYRAYVFACTALVEAFMNHHVTVLDAEGRDTTRFDNVVNFEKRLEIWLDEFSETTLDVVKQTAAWGHLLELRRVRNSSLHGLEPVLGESLRKLPRMLNHARTGVGNFIGELRRAQDLPPLGWMRRLQTLPEVEFRSHRKRVKK